MTSYLPEGGEGIGKAFKDADIVVIPAGIPRKLTPWRKQRVHIVTVYRQTWYDP